MSLRARVTIALLVVALPLALLVAYVSARARRDAFLEATYAAVVERMEYGGRELCEADPARFATAAARRARRRPGMAALLRGARVYAYDASFRSADPLAPPIEPGLRAGLEGGAPALLGASEGGRTDVALQMPWSDGPCAVLLVRARNGALPVRERTVARDVVIAVVVLLGALAAALLALGPPLARLRRLVAAVRGSPAAGYVAPRGVDGHDEIGEVAKALEEASVRVRDHVKALETRDLALRSYVDGTTHDLAIPLTVLQGRLSAAEEAVRAGAVVDPSLLRGALAECEYLGQLVANLGAAARLEAAEPAIERRAVDLGALVERVIARHTPVARQHGVSLDHAVPEATVRLLGDELLLERAVSNLVHNAIRHRTARQGAEGHVAVVLETPGSGARVRVSVLDDGAPVDDELLERLRAGEDARVTRDARGRGLGLRIVRAVAAAHGLVLSFERAPEGGLLARLEGEAAREPSSSAGPLT